MDDAWNELVVKVPSELVENVEDWLNENGALFWESLDNDRARYRGSLISFDDDAAAVAFKLRWCDELEFV